MDQNLAELQKLKRPELIELAKKEGIDFKPSWNNKQLAFFIKKTLIKRAAPPKPAGDDRAKVEDRPANPEFEAVLNEQPPDGRGGPRPGAGRTPGLTNEAAKVRNLPTLANETIAKAVETMFSIWSRKVNVPAVALTIEEARGLALPITQLQEYYFPSGIPEIAWVWASAGFTFYTVVNSRLLIIEQARKAKQQAQGSDGQTGHNNSAGEIGVGQNPQGS